MIVRLVWLSVLLLVALLLPTARVWISLVILLAALLELRELRQLRTPDRREGA